MSTLLKIILLVTLLLFVGGCSTYTVVYAPRSEDDPAPAGGWAYAVKSGDKVRVTLNDESEIKGKVTSLSTDSLIVDTGIHRTDKIAIGADLVKIVEKRVGSGGKTALLVTGIIVGSIAFMAIGLAASGGPMGGG